MTGSPSIVPEIPERDVYLVSESAVRGARRRKKMTTTPSESGTRWSLHVHRPQAPPANTRRFWRMRCLLLCYVLSLFHLACS